MKKRSKKWMSLLLTGVMAASVIGGCGAPKTDNAGAVPVDEKGEAMAIDTSTVDTYTVFLSGSAAVDFNWDNPVAEEITRRTGVRLQPDIALEDPQQKIALMLASGEYDDLILNCDGSMEAMLGANAYVALDDLIDTYGPNIKNFYGDLYDRIRFTDGKIYGFGTGAGQTSGLTPGFYFQVGYFLQNQTLKEQGYPEVKTLEDFEAIIRKDLEAHPTTEDGQKRYGMSLVTSDGFRFQFSIEQPAILSSGNPLNGQYVVKDDLSGVELAYRQDFFREYIRWYNKMYNDGLIDPESFTQNYDTYLAKVAVGRVAGVIDGGWEFTSANLQLRDNSNGELAYTGFPCTVEEGTQWLSDQPGDVAQNGGFSITTACENPEKLVNFFNFLASEEGQILTEWGIEGVNYTVDSEGNRVRNPEDVTAEANDPSTYTLKTGVKQYTRDINEWLHQPYGYKTSNGQLLISDDMDAIDQVFTDTEREVLSKYDAKYHTDMFPDPLELDVRPYGQCDSLSFGTDEEIKVIKQKFDESRLPQLAKAIMCAPEEFDGIWDAYMAELDAIGVDKMVDAVNTSFLNRLEQWGVK